MSYFDFGYFHGDDVFQYFVVRADCTREEAQKIIRRETEKEIALEQIKKGYVRYYPHGSQDWEDFEELDGGGYAICPKAPGAFGVWICDIREEKECEFY